MIIVKTILGSAIVCVTTYLGILKSKNLLDREKILKEYLSFLNLVENEIRYNLSMLPNAMEVARINLKSKFKEVIGSIVVSMLKGENTDEVIFESVDSIAELTSYDKNIIITMLKSLGKGDLESQINLIENNKKIIEEQIKEATKLKEKDSKVYKTIGMVSGLIIVVIFV